MSLARLSDFLLHQTDKSVPTSRFPVLILFLYQTLKCFELTNRFDCGDMFKLLTTEDMEGGGETHSW